MTPDELREKGYRCLEEVPYSVEGRKASALEAIAYALLALSAPELKEEVNENDF